MYVLVFVTINRRIVNWTLADDGAPTSLQSISPTFYACIFFVQKFVQSQTLSREKLLKRLTYKKCVHKKLMKLTPGPNSLPVSGPSVLVIRQIWLTVNETLVYVWNKRINKYKMTNNRLFQAVCSAPCVSASWSRFCKDDFDNKIDYLFQYDWFYGSRHMLSLRLKSSRLHLVHWYTSSR